MNMVRLNITLPRDVGVILSNVKNKSSFIASAVKEKIERERRVKLRKAAEKMKKEYEVNKELTVFSSALFDSEGFA
jgi:hypothetical protein